MIKAEWQFLWRHKLMLGILTVLMLVPMLYTTIFLSSMWNPYGKTGDLPVAVVNQDQTTNYNGQKLAVGKQLTHKLRHNNSLDFKFPKSEKVAQDGLKAGKYYMVITIPKDFSKNASTAFTTHPKKMKLRYTTNYGSSYVAGKMATSAAEKIARNVSTTMTKTYTSVMVVNLAKMQATLQTAAQASPQLATALQGNSSQTTTQLTKATINQLAEPVTTVHHDISNVPNNGTGMTPYMMTVALFVGCLALNLMYDVITPRRLPKNGLSWWAAKMSVVGTFAILQAVVAYGAMIVFLGLKPVHPYATLLMVICTSAAFSNLVTFLGVACGKVGNFLALLLLIFQLGGSAGTYPIELSNKFFIGIHKWLPASYSVHGLRESIMIGQSTTTDVWILLAIAIVSALLMIVAYRIRLKKLPKIDYEKLAQ